ncbi:MAG: hypothetical protein ACP5E2_09185 [Terracidiphilus sp.]
MASGTVQMDTRKVASGTVQMDTRKVASGTVQMDTWLRLLRKQRR